MALSSCVPAQLLSADTLCSCWGTAFGAMGCFLGVPAIADCVFPSLGSQMAFWGGGGGGWVGHLRVLAYPYHDVVGCCSMQMQSLCSLPIMRYQEPQEEDGLEDMTQLE